MGIQVIATNLPGVGAPVKQPGSGLLVNPRLVRFNADKPLKILEISLDRIGGSERIKRNHEIWCIADAYEEAYLRMIMERE